MVEATGFVCFHFLKNNEEVHVRLDYRVYETLYGYHIEFTNISTRDPTLLHKLRDPKVKEKVLTFVTDQLTGKLPPKAELYV